MVDTAQPLQPSHRWFSPSLAVRTAAINYKSLRGDAGLPMRCSTGNVGCRETTSAGSGRDSRQRRDLSTSAAKCHPNPQYTLTDRQTGLQVSR